MAESNTPLKDLEVASYGEVANRPNPKHLIIQFIPSLAALLLRAEQIKGSPLTQAQVEAIRDSSSVMVSSPEAAKAVDDRRGYNDIDPKYSWQQWQELRVQFH